MVKWTDSFYQSKEVAKGGLWQRHTTCEWLGEGARESSSPSARSGHILGRLSHGRFRRNKRRNLTWQFSWAVNSAIYCCGYKQIILEQVRKYSEWLGTLPESWAAKGSCMCVCRLQLGKALSWQWIRRHNREVSQRVAVLWPVMCPDPSASGHRILDLWMVL